MRQLISACSLLALSASPALAAAEGGKVSLLDPHYGLITWTIVVFTVTLLTLRKFAWGPILAAVRGREQALLDAIAAPERDRNAAAAMIAEQKAASETARHEAQRAGSPSAAAERSEEDTMA